MKYIIVLVAILTLSGCSRKLHLLKKKEKDNHITVKVDSASLHKIDNSSKLTTDSSLTISHTKTTGTITTSGSVLDALLHLNDTAPIDTSYSNDDVDVDIKYNPQTKKLNVQTKVKPKTIPVNIDKVDSTFNHKTTFEKNSSDAFLKTSNFSFIDSTKTRASTEKTVTHSTNWTLIIIIVLIILILIIALKKYFKL